MYEFIDDGDISDVTMTDKGREAVEDILFRFSEGETIEQIAASYDLTPEAIQVLIAIDTLTKENL